MKRVTGKQFAVSLALVLIGGSAIAQQGQPEGEARDTDPGRPGASGSGTQLEEMVLSAPDELEGVKIVDEAGKELGEVQRAVLKRGTSDVYLIVSSDSFLGLGGEDVVVSVQDLSIDGDNQARLRSQEAVELYNAADFLEIEVVG